MKRRSLVAAGLLLFMVPFPLKAETASPSVNVRIRELREQLDSFREHIGFLKRDQISQNESTDQKASDELEHRTDAKVEVLFHDGPETKVQMVQKAPGGGTSDSSSSSDGQKETTPAEPSGPRESSELRVMSQEQEKPEREQKPLP